MSCTVVIPASRHSAAPSSVRARTSSTLRIGYCGGSALTNHICSGIGSNMPFSSTSCEW